jgi:hypothetical protein
LNLVAKRLLLLARRLERALGGEACRVCGCTQHAACAGGCFWVEPELCSSCTPDEAIARGFLRELGIEIS